MVFEHKKKNNLLKITPNDLKSNPCICNILYSQGAKVGKKKTVILTFILICRLLFTKALCERGIHLFYFPSVVHPLQDRCDFQKKTLWILSIDASSSLTQALSKFSSSRKTSQSSSKLIHIWKQNWKFQRMYLKLRKEWIKLGYTKEHY